MSGGLVSKALSTMGGDNNSSGIVNKTIAASVGGEKNRSGIVNKVISSMGGENTLRAVTLGASDKLGFTKDPVDSIQMPAVQKQELPPTKELGADRMDLLRKRRRFGRSSTVKAGNLEPTNLGYKSLLG